VVKAVLVKAQKTKTIALIESTSNQVNQEGGYTGMTTADFRDFVYDIADSINLDRRRIVLGGDHLGPLPWCDEPEEQAMEKAAELVQSCVLAGYTKIHLDTSMRVGDDDTHVALDVAVCARRGAYLCQKSEEAFAQYKAEHPEAKVVVHPECRAYIIEVADYVGSTAGILEYCGKSEAEEFIVVTEAGILAEMRKRYPEKQFIPAPPIDSTCGCNECRYMKMVTLENILECLENESPEVEIDEPTRKAAERSIINMVNIK
jgi:hypothetical protein